jgi:heat shock protein HtpX
LKRIALFILTNLAVLVVLTIALRLLGIDQVMTQNGIDYRALLVFSVVVGFAGSIISLLMSKPMAKMSTGAQIIDGSENSDTRWLVETVRRLAERAGIGMPEVAVYEGPANAFATGAFRNSALVAVSSGLLQSMNREEVEAVLGHEVAHVANGDMVTMTLIQGVVNTFVIFLSRVVGFFVDRAIFRNDREGTGPGFFITVLVCQILFGLLASIIVAWFSRQREFRADAGSATFLNTPKPMINALARLGGVEPQSLPEGIRTLGITDKKGLLNLFSTHPPIEERIARLQAQAR